MIFGREIWLPIDLLFGEPGSESDRNVYGTQYGNDLRDRLNEVHEFARNRMRAASDAMKRKYDIKSNLKVFQVGDAVWVFDPTRKVSINPKLLRPWKGPFKIIEKLSDILYAVRQFPRHEPRIFHHDKLKKYLGRNLRLTSNEKMYFTI